MNGVVRLRRKWLRSWRRRESAPSHRLALEVLEDRLAPSVTIGVDATANQHAIDPDIYGTAFADRTALADLNAPLNRMGGNTTSTYNWQQNASNHAADWYYESIADQG